MNAPHAIHYLSGHPISRAAAAVQSPGPAAARRAVYLSERDFLDATRVTPLQQAVPLAAPAPDNGPLDFSDRLGIPGPATLPSLLAGTHTLPAGGSTRLAQRAGAAIVLVLEGSGRVDAGGESADVTAGDILAVPGPDGVAHAGAQGLRLYYVDDSPMTRYLGWQVQPGARSPLVHWSAAALAASLEQTAAQGITASGVFLSHGGLTREKLATPNLFAHLNRLLPGASNTVHAHAAAAITYVIEANARSYSLLGEQVAHGAIVGPTRLDWQPGQVSLTPPNLWHGHYNDGDTPVVTLVVQPSGVYYNDRTMNFAFAAP